MAGGGDITTQDMGSPLAGCTVLVTRAKRQAEGLAAPLEALGARVLVAPVIETVEPLDWAPADEAIQRLARYDWVVLTSANAVDRFTGRMLDLGVPLGALASASVAVVGSATAARLEELGIEPALVPADFRAEGLVEAFAEMGAEPGWRVLIPRAEQAREILPDALRQSGVTVDIVPVYRTVPATPEPAVIEPLLGDEVDVVTFTSPSTVRHFLAWLEAAGLQPADVMAQVTSASIGPVTSEALRAAGHDPQIEAGEYTAAGLVEAIRSWRDARGTCRP